MARTPVSGIQHTLRAGAYDAVVASVGATLRTLSHGGRDLVLPFAADEVRPSYRGALLAPWPNRVVDGHYRFDGRDLQLPLTEPARHHAMHGLASWLDFAAVDSDETSVTLATTIQPQTGYPWRIRVETTFALDDDGLTQTVRATNESTDVAPWGTGMHPYLVAGAGAVDDWTLSLPASAVLHVTPDRLIPTELRSVDTEDPERFDFREPRRIGTVQLDHAYTAITRDADAVATVRVTDAAGSGVEMTWGAACPWVQVYTSDKGGRPGDRAALAVEPMTCAPDAFNAQAVNAQERPYDAGLIVLEPDAVTTASWRISAV